MGMNVSPVDNVGSLGILKDDYAPDVPMNGWTGGANVRMKDGYVERIGNNSTIFDSPAVVPYFMLPATGTAGKFLVYAGLNKFYCALAGVHSNITRQSAGVDVDYTATAENVWTGGVLSGITILNNGFDSPQSWVPSAANKAQNLANWPANTACKSMRPFKNFLIALNVTKVGVNYPYMVKWSHPADPGSVPISWDQTDATKDAGETDLGDDYGPIIDGLEMGDVFIVYRETAYYALQYIGPPYIFRVQKISSLAGAMTRNCIAAFPGGHVVFGASDIVRHSGGDPVSICSGRMQRWIYNNIDGTYFQRSFLMAHPNHNEIWCCFPQSGSSSCNLAAVWNWQEDTWAIRDLPNVSCGTVGVFNSTTSDIINNDTGIIDNDNSIIDFSAYASTTKRMVLGSTGYAQTGTEIGSFSAYVEHEGMTLGNPDRVKMVRSVRPRIDAPPGTVVQIQVGAAMSMESGTLWQQPVNFVVGQQYKADSIASGRYLAVRFKTPGNAKWRLRSYDLEYKMLGRY